MPTRETRSGESLRQRSRRFVGIAAEVRRHFDEAPVHVLLVIALVSIVAATDSVRGRLGAVAIAVAAVACMLALVFNSAFRQHYVLGEDLDELRSQLFWHASQPLGNRALRGAGWLLHLLRESGWQYEQARPSSATDYYALVASHFLGQITPGACRLIGCKGPYGDKLLQGIPVEYLQGIAVLLAVAGKLEIPLSETVTAVAPQEWNEVSTRHRTALALLHFGVASTPEELATTMSLPVDEIRSLLVDLRERGLVNDGDGTP